MKPLRYCLSCVADLPEALKNLSVWSSESTCGWNYTSLGARISVESRRDCFRTVTRNDGTSVTSGSLLVTVEETLIEKSNPASSTVAHSAVTSSSSMGLLQQLRFQDGDPFPIVRAASAEDLSLNDFESLETIRKFFSTFGCLRGENKTASHAVKGCSVRFLMIPMPGEWSVALISYLTFFQSCVLARRRVGVDRYMWVAAYKDVRSIFGPHPS